MAGEAGRRATPFSAHSLLTVGTAVSYSLIGCSCLQLQPDWAKTLAAARAASRGTAGGGTLAVAGILHASLTLGPC